MTQTYTSVLQVEVGGAALADPLAALLVSGWVETSLNLPAAFRLVFSDPGGEVLDTARQLAVGARVRLLPITDGRPGEPLLTGEITGLELDADAVGRTLVVRGYDPAHRLLRTRRVAGYPNTTAADIVRALATRNGLTIGTVDATRTVYELATQPNTTDWDFLTRLAAENDVHLYVDRTGRLQFTAQRRAGGAPAGGTSAAQSPFVLEFGANALHSRVGVTAAGRAGRVSARGWDPRRKRPLVADAPATGTDAADIDITPDRLGSAFGGAVELVEAGRPYTTQAQVQQVASAVADDVAASFAELEVAVTGNPELVPGVPVALTGAGYPFEGKYTVTSARHVFEAGRRYTTWVEVTGRQVRSLYGLLSAAAPADEALPGVAVGLVRNAKDPTGAGRVKLGFPWLSDTYESDWCRVAQFGGVRGGGLLLPEVGDEVLVAFDRGSLEHPYVLAGLYNGVDRPPRGPRGLDPVDGTSGAVNWRSVAARNGHRLELVDAPAARASGIRLSTGDDALTVHLDQTASTVTVDSRGRVRIEGAAGVQVRAGTDLDLRAGGRVSISAGGAVDIRAGAAVGLQAGGLVNVRSGAATTVTSVGPIALSSTLSTAVQAPTMTITAPVTLINGIPR
jgi:phage protein D/phage baseplate assembly protein gpV